MIAIIDYGMGNLGSIKNMLKKIKVKCLITNRANEIAAADKLILPGVGSFGKAMENITKLNLVEVLNEQVLEKKKPVLGICLGMQLLANYSEEGNVAGLGWVDGDIIKFSFDIDDNLKVPHMGWNTVSKEFSDPFYNEMPDEMRFYFVHSYYMRSNGKEQILGKTKFGVDFTSIVKKDNIYGTQFHPEKSHKFGMQLLSNFSEFNTHLP